MYGMYINIYDKRTHKKIIESTFPSAKIQLNKIGSAWEKALDRIESKEKHINKEFAHLRNEFHEKQEHLKSISERYNSLNEVVSDLTNQLGEHIIYIYIYNIQK